MEQKYPLSVYCLSLYVLGNFKLPNAYWHLMYSNCIREKDYLQLFSNWGLRPLIFAESTHCDGNTLDKILCSDHSYPISLQITKQDILSDQYLINFKVGEYPCPRSNSFEFAISKPLESLFFKKNNWSHFAFSSCLSPVNVNEFNKFLWTNIASSFWRKKKNALVILSITRLIQSFA